MAGKSTLNRLELSANGTDDATKKIAHDPGKMRALLIEEGVRRIPRKSDVVVIDLDATDDPLHGNQEGRFFHGYYRHYCYLPLYAFCGDIPLLAQLRKSDIDGAAGSLEAVQEIVGEVRRRLGKKVRIIVRADSGFCRDDMLDWFEGQDRVHYVVGLAKNPVLKRRLEEGYREMLEGELGGAAFDELRAQADVKANSTSETDSSQTSIWDLKLPADLSCERFLELRYRTKKSWSRERRVVGKAAVTQGKFNPRFIVTDIPSDADWVADASKMFGEGAEGLYRKFYCARGDMENRIKEQQMDLFASRTSTGKMASNQLRLHLATFAYMLIRDLRAVALGDTRLAKASPGTLRLRLFKIAAQITVSVRRVYVRLCSACPEADLFAVAHKRLQCFELPA